MTINRRPVRGFFQYCKIQKRVVPIDEVLVEVHANVAHGVLPDDMAPTKNPVDGKIYTSKSKYRETLRAHGKYEVGNDWNDDNDIKELKTRESAQLKKLTERFKERYVYGKLTRKHH